MAAKRTHTKKHSVRLLGKERIPLLELQQKIDKAVQKELDRVFAPLIFQAGQTLQKTRQTNRILRRVLENPSEDMHTIVKQGEEEACN